MAEKFSKVSERQALTVNFSGMLGDPEASFSQSPSVEGIVFERFSLPSLLVKSLQVNRSHCMVINNEYTRWSKVWSEASGLFSLILPIISKYTTISAIGLQYADMFSWRGDRQDFELSALFSRDSQFLPRHVYGLADLWHIHQGYFYSPAIDIDMAYKVLNNINSNLLDIDGSLVVQIITAHRLVFANKSTDMNGYTTQSGLLDRVYEALHNENKTILADLLTDDIKNKIKL